MEKSGAVSQIPSRVVALKDDDDEFDIFVLSTPFILMFKFENSEVVLINVFVDLHYF